MNKYLTLVMVLVLFFVLWVNASACGDASAPEKPSPWKGIVVYP